MHFLIIAYFAFGIYQKYVDNQYIIESNLGILKTFKDQITKKEKEKVAAKEFAKNIETARERNENMTRELDILKKKFPSNISQEEDTSLLKNITDNLNMKNIEVSFVEEDDKEFYLIKRYSLKAQGTYLQYLIFLEKMSEIDRFLSIKSVKLETPDNPIRGRYQLINTTTLVESFSRNEVSKEEDEKNDEGGENDEQKS